MTSGSTEVAERRIWPIALAEAAALMLAVVAMIYLDLGWIGAILIAAVVAVFTVMIFRAGEQTARASGNFSPAMGRYNRRMLAARDEAAFQRVANPVGSAVRRRNEAVLRKAGVEVLAEIYGAR